MSISTAAANLELGKYQHYKGGFYEVFGVAKHSETKEEFVVYQNIASQELWVRPLTMFLEQVEHNGRLAPRFALIKD